jgi:CXXX repeat radical SAM target protein
VDLHKNGVRFMKDDKDGNVTVARPSEEKTENIDRRGFLSMAGKIVIPTLGIIGLTLAAVRMSAAAVTERAKADAKDICFRTVCR